MNRMKYIGLWKDIIVLLAHNTQVRRSRVRVKVFWLYCFERARYLFLMSVSKRLRVALQQNLSIRTLQCENASLKCYSLKSSIIFWKSPLATHTLSTISCVAVTRWGWDSNSFSLTLENSMWPLCSSYPKRERERETDKHINRCPSVVRKP